MLQSVFLRIVNKVGLFALQISGLWPFAYDHQAKKFKFLWYFTIVPLLIMSYPLVVVLFWSKYVSKEIYVKNAVVTILSVGFLAFNALNFDILFICQYLKFNEIKALILRSDRVINKLNNELDRNEYKYGKLLLKFSMKTGIFMSLLIYSMVQSMTRFTKFEDNYLVYVMSVLPNVIMKLQPDLFYGGLMMINFFITQINGKVSGVLTKAKDLSENNDLNEQKRYQKMINFCELSDQLDRLCVLQCSVIELSERFCRICSFQITLWVALGLCVFLVNMFQEYISISTSIKHDRFSWHIFINELIGIFLVVAEVYLTIAMSDNVMAECRKTGMLLNMPLMRRNIDVRFKRSVEIYSRQILLKNLTITGSELFIFDSTLMYSLASTASSYLLILIQFELKSS